MINNVVHLIAEWRRDGRMKGGNYLGYLLGVWMSYVFFTKPMSQKLANFCFDNFYLNLNVN
jgi:hypothetical protein